MAPTRHYVSISEAAERVGVSTKTVRRWIATGALTGYRIGPRVVRIDAAELDAALRRIPTAGQVGA